MKFLIAFLDQLNDILGAIAPLNILGGAINYVLNLLGISCSGPDRSCSKKKQTCTNGAEELEDEDFLDGCYQTSIIYSQQLVLITLNMSVMMLIKVSLYSLQLLDSLVVFLQQVELLVIFLRWMQSTTTRQ